MGGFGLNNLSSLSKYAAFMGSPQKVSWAKLMCQNSAPAKCLFIAWLVMHDRLPTCSYLRRIGIIVDTTCCLCNQEVETVEHMFFQCEYAAAVWKMVTEWSGISRLATNWSNEKRY